MPEEPSEEPVAVFRGSRASCDELRLVLEATALPYQMVDEGDAWALLAEPAVADRARVELARYGAERSALAQQKRARRGLRTREPFGGAIAGAAGYVLTLLLVAHCAGDSVFGTDWLAAGALQAQAAGRLDWWRSITALTLHADPGHLVSNLFFGIAGGVLCTRLLGYGIAWLSILLAGAFANYLEMWISPTGHEAIGASTAVFASLGLLSGYAWRLRLTLRERWLYRWTPLIGGISILAFLGAGGEHAERVDVLGHLLGFSAGVALGWVYALAGVPRSRRAAPQNGAAAAGLGIVALAWAMALYASGTGS